MEQFILPVIDCSKILKGLENTPDEEYFKKFSDDFASALKQHGFVYLINHGVPPVTVETFFKKSAEFFELPEAIKAKYQKQDLLNDSFGFIPPGIERAVESAAPKRVTSSLAKREAFDFPGNEFQDELSYPLEDKNWVSTVKEFASSTVVLIRILLRSLGIHLELEDPEFFLKCHKSLEDAHIESASNIRSTHYFPLDPRVKFPPDQDSFRLLRHTDWGTMTLLFQDNAGGLESQLSNGDWVSLNPMKDSIVLQVGQTLEMLTGGHFPAVPHRVRLTRDNSKVTRQSIAFFLHPDAETPFSPCIPSKPNWTPLFPEATGKTQAEFALMRRKRTTVVE